MAQPLRTAVEYRADGASPNPRGSPLLALRRYARPLRAQLCPQQATGDRRISSRHLDGSRSQNQTLYRRSPSFAKSGRIVFNQLFSRPRAKPRVQKTNRPLRSHVGMAHDGPAANPPQGSLGPQGDRDVGHRFDRQPQATRRVRSAVPRLARPRPLPTKNPPGTIQPRQADVVGEG